MANRIFTGPPNNKVTAATIANAVATLFWMIAARTFWTDLAGEDLAVYISASAVVITAIVGYLVPGSAPRTRPIPAGPATDTNP